MPRERVKEGCHHEGCIIHQLCNCASPAPGKQPRAKCTTPLPVLNDEILASVPRINPAFPATWDPAIRHSGDDGDAGAMELPALCHLEYASRTCSNFRWKILIYIADVE